MKQSYFNLKIALNSKRVITKLSKIDNVDELLTWVIDSTYDLQTTSCYFHITIINNFRLKS